MFIPSPQNIIINYCFIEKINKFYNRKLNL